jgi:hypothetical protein
MASSSGICSAGASSQSEEREATSPSRVREVVDLELTDLRPDVGLVGEERRPDDERPQRSGHAVVEIEAGQGHRPQQVRDDPVHERDREVRRWHEAEEREPDQRDRRRAAEGGHGQWDGEDQRGHQRDRPEIGARRLVRIGPPETDREWRVMPEDVLEGGPAVREEPAAVRLARRGRRSRPLRVSLPAASRPAPEPAGCGDAGCGDAGCGDVEAAQPPTSCRHGDDLARDVDSSMPDRSARLDRVAVSVSRREVHRRERPGAVQDVVDDADASTNSAQSNHEIRRMLVIAFRPSRSSSPAADARRGRSPGRGAVFDHEPLEPAQPGRHVRVLVAQPLEELTRAATENDAGGERLSAATASSGESRPSPRRLSGELIGSLAVRAAADDADGDPAEVVDQEEAKADRDRPQPADRERLDLLVSRTIRRRLSGSNRLSVWAMCARARPDDLGYPARLSSASFELVVVVRWKIVAIRGAACRSREVVDEPLGRRRDRSLLLDRPGEGPIRLAEDASVLGHPRRDRPPVGRIRRGRLRPGEAAGMVLEPFDAEELGLDRLLEIDLRSDAPPNAVRGRPEGLGAAHAGAARRNES